MNDEQPGPRDWRPSDPSWQWGNPGPDDERRPLFRDRFADPPNLRPPAQQRPAEPPEPPKPREPAPEEPASASALGLFALLAVLICCSGTVGAWMPPRLQPSLQGPALAVLTVAIGLTIGGIALASSGLLRTAQPAYTATAPARIVFNTVVGFAALLGPAGAAARFLTTSWVPPATLAGAGLFMALVFWFGTVAAQEGVGLAIGWIATLATVLAVTVGGILAVRAIVPDPLRDKGTAFTATPVQTPTPSWRPPAGAQARAELDIRHDLESRVLKVAGVARPVTSGCVPALHDCWVRYGEVEVRWRINVTSTTPGSVRYEAETDALAITREGVQAQLSSHHRRAHELRCDELPDVALAPLGRPFGPHCYVVHERSDDSVRMEIVATEDGVRFQEAD
jgi:hypothetical protein